MMGVYAGYSYLKTQGNVIEVGPTCYGGVVRKRGCQYVILVGDSQELEEQVKAAIHELLHLSPENISYITGGGMQVRGHNQKLEDRIEQEAALVYSCQPVLVAHLRERIFQARRNNNHS